MSNSTKITQFRNCNILFNHKIIREDLWVRGGKILNPEKLFFEERKSADEQIDCNQVIIAPGFIDVQVNGAVGVDFSLPTDDLSAGVKNCAKHLLSHGVTSFCPTLVTSSPEDYKQIIPLIHKTRGCKEGAGILGIHLEGPFISKEKRGAHVEDLVIQFDNGFADLLKVYGSLQDVNIVTLAPEQPNSSAVIKELVQRGIKVSVGHSVADLSQGEVAVNAGANFITHLFNAMLPFHHRDPHLVGLLASHSIPDSQPVFYGIISDGIHTHPAALRIAHRIHPDGLVLVTDAIPAMGLHEGIHHIGHQVVEIKNKRATIAGTDTLCGSIATMNECIQFFLKAVKCSKEDALETATLHPAQMLGITDQKGTLDYGTDADFVMLDHDLNVKATYIAGECVWRKST